MARAILNLIEGAATILEVCPPGDRPDYPVTRAIRDVEDADAIRQDWETVGADLQASLEHVAKENALVG